MNKNKTIIFTGGHHNAALEVAKELINRGYTVLWLGHKFSMVGNRTVSVEYRDVTLSGIPFTHLASGKIHQGSMASWLQVIKAIRFCYLYFRKTKPDLIISFGGYLAVPPVIAGRLLGIPSVTHEQTLSLGLANKAIFPLVNRVYLAWPNAKLEKNSKVKFVGLPVPIKDGRITKIQLNELLKKDLGTALSQPEGKWLMVSGGKQGSHVLNCFIENNLEKLLENWNIIHQTGDNLVTNDFFRLKEKQAALSENLRNKYLLFPYSHHFSEILSVSDLLIGRSGAHTVYEALLQKKKMVAIPLPFSSRNEQFKNAQLLEKVGLAVILEQKDLNWESFLKSLNIADQLTLNKDIYQELTKKILSARPLETITEDIISLLISS